MPGTAVTSSALFLRRAEPGTETHKASDLHLLSWCARAQTCAEGLSPADHTHQIRAEELSPMYHPRKTCEETPSELVLRRAEPGAEKLKTSDLHLLFLG